MPSYRIDRISEEVRQGLDTVIRSMNDPRIKGTFSLTRVEVTRDLKYAKVYVSILEDDLAEELLGALKKASGFIRHELRNTIQLRVIPELIFIHDRNIAYGIYIDQLLKKVGAEHETDQNAE